MRKRFQIRDFGYSTCLSAHYRNEVENNILLILNKDVCDPLYKILAREIYHSLWLRLKKQSPKELV